MKKVIISTVLILIPSCFFAQTVFDKFDGQDHVTSIVVNKKMFEMISKVEIGRDNIESQQYLNSLKKLDHLKVFMTTNDKVSGDMKVTVNKYLSTNTMEELMHLNSDGKNVKIYVKSDTSDIRIRELLMFAQEGGTKETVLMYLAGNFDINEISVLLNKMNIPGSEALKGISKK